MRALFLILIVSLCNSLALQAMDYSNGQNAAANNTYVGAYFSMPLGGGKVKAKQERFKYGLTAEYRQNFNSGYGSKFGQYSTNFKELRQMKLMDLSFSQSGFKSFNVVNLPLISKGVDGRLFYLAGDDAKDKDGNPIVTGLLWGGAIIGGLAVLFIASACGDKILDNDDDKFMDSSDFCPD